MERPTLAPDASVDDYRAMIEEGIRLGLPTFEAMVAGMQEIDPPAEVADAHQRLLDAYRQAIEASEGILEMIAKVATYEDIALIYETYKISIDDAAGQPCQELQEIADGYGIDPGLGCLAQ